MMIRHFGAYFILMRQVFRRPDKSKVFWKQLLVEMQSLGVDSLGIVAIISIFMGAVVALQTAFNIDSPLIPAYTVGFTTRQSMILEFSPTVISLILAGKIGSRIASEIGTMRVTEQIDAMQIMGVNAANFLIFPKMVAAIIFNPILIVISMFLGVFGGWMACISSGLISSQDYVVGIRAWFDPFAITYAMIKTITFAILIVTVSSYHGYRISGGALEVGRASTKSVVYSSILIIIFNLVLTQLLLT
jgi:phospholipid/cholesterol/gamma-HCH transport system permease protein